MARALPARELGPAAQAEFYERPSSVVGPDLLNRVLVTRVDGHAVALRITEVEAYGGVGIDPGSHAYRSRTPRNASLFLPGGHLYVYRSYGIHWCGNIVTGEHEGASGVLIRAGEVIGGAVTARQRRERSGSVASPRDLARGPGRVGAALGLSKALDGIAIEPGGLVSLHLGKAGQTVAVAAQLGVSSRTGIRGAGSVVQWRYFLVGDSTVSPHRPLPA